MEHFFSIICLSVGLVGFDSSVANLPNELEEFLASFYPMFTVILVLSIIALGMDILLFFGAEQKNCAMCSAWFGFMAVVLVLKVISMISLLSGGFGESGINFLVEEFVGNFLIILLSIYLLFVVFTFIIQLRNRPNQQLYPINQASTSQDLTYGEMETGSSYAVEEPKYSDIILPPNQPQPASGPA